MARLYGGIVGNRGEATRLGTAKSGMRAFVQGWSSGVKVYASVTSNDRDEFDVYMTSGSNGGRGDVYLGRVCIADAGDRLPHFYPSDHVRTIAGAR
jgi:hypothetical protein